LNSWDDPSGAGQRHLQELLLEQEDPLEQDDPLEQEEPLEHEEPDDPSLPDSEPEPALSSLRGSPESAGAFAPSRWLAGSLNGDAWLVPAKVPAAAPKRKPLPADDESVVWPWL
jgi:hypothetical protein